jgi:hypothetical protein
MNSERLTRSLPAHSAFGLPVYVTASQAAPFLGSSWTGVFARNEKDGHGVHSRMTHLFNVFHLRTLL